MGRREKDGVVQHDQFRRVGPECPRADVLDQRGIEQGPLFEWFERGPVWDAAVGRTTGDRHQRSPDVREATQEWTPNAGEEGREHGSLLD